MPGLSLIEYHDTWPAQFAAVGSELASIFAGAQASVEHIGRTAVPGLLAKPVLDVLLGAPCLADIELRIAPLASLSYAYRPSYEQLIPDRRYFVRDASAAMRVHLHAVVKDEAIWRDHLCFRDALRGDPKRRHEYAALKVSLAEKYRHDKAAYTDAKAPFIQRVIAAGRARPG